MESVKTGEGRAGARAGDAMGEARGEGRTPNAEHRTLNSQLSTLNSQVGNHPCGAELLPSPLRPLGGRKKARNAGDAGWAAVYSFNGNKIITTSGGGMIASRDAGVVERARKRAQQAREPVVWYEHRELGYNHRMSNLVAAVGVGQLEALERILAKKRQIFEWYRERLEGVPGVSLMPEAGYGRCSRWLTVALLRPRSGRNGECKNGPGERVMRVIEALERENVESRPVWKPMHLQPVFEGARVIGGAVSEHLFANGLCLPSGTGLERDDVARICGVVAAALAREGDTPR
ncbi:MAG: DegT/DnrJ/EryC1/StrS family aminotransferase [Kiritimatiellae bacterium]|nr:DegT/DnrJ/EryC1/StrS family aminotransferase [Kiritimatiellia bacterium]